VLAGTLAAAAALAGCGAPSPTSPAVPGAVQASPVLPAGAQLDVRIPPASPQSNQACNGGHFTASLAPTGPPPAPAQMAPGSYMAAIASRGYLRAGVDQNTYLWAYRDPATGNLAGFDIDMVNQVAQAIFGPRYQSHIRYVIVPNADRLSAVSSGQVDLVAETMTITCPREQTVDFSTEYYDASQGVLVPDGSPITSLAGLDGKRVCAAAGSTSLANLAREAPTAQLVSVTNQTDCLVMLQQGQIDAISTDDTILQGLAAQDPHVHLVLGLRLSDEPYGMAISKAHPDFTRFVNGVLAQERANGTWATIWLRWLGPVLQTRPPAPPAPVYRS
jgi:polar amino acid transport system substrate-binding protein